MWHKNLLISIYFIASMLNSYFDEGNASITHLICSTKSKCDLDQYFSFSPSLFERSYSCQWHILLEINFIRVIINNYYHTMPLFPFKENNMEIRSEAEFSIFLKQDENMNFNLKALSLYFGYMYMQYQNAVGIYVWNWKLWNLAHSCRISIPFMPVIPFMVDDVRMYLHVHVHVQQQTISEFKKSYS